MYRHTNTYVYVCTVCVGVCVYIYVYTHTHAHAHAHKHIYMRVCVRVCVYICVCVCACLYICNSPSRSDGTVRQGSSTPSHVVEDIGNSTPNALQVLSSSSLGREGVSSFDPGVFEASLSDSLLSARVKEDGISLVVKREDSEQALGPPLVLTGKGGLSWFVLIERLVSHLGEYFETCELDYNTHESHFMDKGRVKGRNSGLDWPWFSSKDFSSAADLIEPLAVDFSCLHNNSGSFSVEEIWDGQNLIQELVSKWVASKLKRVWGVVLGWLSLVMNWRLSNSSLKLKRVSLHPSLVCRELRLLPGDSGSFEDLNSELTMTSLATLLVG